MLATQSYSGKLSCGCCADGGTSVADAWLLSRRTPGSRRWDSLGGKDNTVRMVRIAFSSGGELDAGFLTTLHSHPD